MSRAIQFTAFGAIFGFLLVRVGATDYDTIAGMFLLSDLHLMGVMGVAMGVAGLGQLHARRRAARGHDVAMITPKPMKPGLVLGAALFGAGWAITGTCPGTGLAQIGEGKVVALFTVAGILLGSALYRRVGTSIEAGLRRVGGDIPWRMRRAGVAGTRAG